MRTAQDVLATAGELADEVLFPDAMRVDRLDVLPAAHLDALAAAGLYGAPAPAAAGGLGLDLVQVANVVEELAGGCLAVAFVLIQHFRLVMTLAEGAPAVLGDRWLASASQGRTRGGIALTGLIPGPPQLRAEPAEGGWRLDGTAPWVTGWGLIDGNHQEGRQHETADGEHAGKERIVAFTQHTEHQDHHPDDRQHQLRQRECPVHHRCIPASLMAGVPAWANDALLGAAIACAWCCTICVTAASKNRVKLVG